MNPLALFIYPLVWSLTCSGTFYLWAATQNPPPGGSLPISLSGFILFFVYSWVPMEPLIFVIGGLHVFTLFCFMQTRGAPTLKTSVALSCSFAAILLFLFMDVFKIPVDPGIRFWTYGLAGVLTALISGLWLHRCANTKWAEHRGR